MKRSKRSAFTLIELLVVVAIIGILIALLIPAVQSARESARRMTCKSHLKQIGLAAQLHVEAHGYFPSGGWYWQWTGDADMGFGVKQPGGWIYSLLPYWELENIHQMGAGLPWNTPEKWKELGEREERAFGLFHCPSRRPPIGYPINARNPNHQLNDYCPIFMPRPDTIAKTDYAANGGPRLNCGGRLEPGVGELNCPKTYPNCRWYPSASGCQSTDTYGIIFPRSEIGLKDIIDGAHCTYFAADKYVNPDRYYSVNSLEDGLSMYHGHFVAVRWCRIKPGCENIRMRPTLTLLKARCNTPPWAGGGDSGV